MARNAGDTLAKDRRAIPDCLVAAQPHRRGNWSVAAEAKVANRALREQVDFVLKGVEHWRDAGVGVAGDRPLVVNLLMTRGAFGR